VQAFATVIALTHRIQWFDRGEATNISQHQHAWIVFDRAYPAGKPPTLVLGVNQLDTLIVHGDSPTSSAMSAHGTQLTYAAFAP
jgi:hypothetical protein